MSNKKKKGPTPAKIISGKLHLWLGLASGLIVFIVSITGCIYVFEEEIREKMHREVLFVEPQAGKSFITADAALAAVTTAFPGEKLKQLRVYSKPDRAWQVHLEKEKAVAINPYSGAVISMFSRHDWLHTVEKIHTSLLLGEVGKWIIRVNILIFLVLLISGIVLWFPGNKARRKQSFKVKWDASAKRVNYDFHNVFGFYSSLFLLVIVFTGMWWSFDWVKRTVYFVTGSPYEKKKEEEKKRMEPGMMMAGNTALYAPVLAYHEASAKYPGAVETHINFPQKSGEPIKLKLHYPYKWYRKTNDIQVDAVSGKVVRENLYANYSAGDKFKHSNYDLHTGRFFGMGGKIFAFLLSLLAASMPVTGFAIWWVRKMKKSPAKKPFPANSAIPAFQPAGV